MGRNREIPSFWDGPSLGAIYEGRVSILAQINITDDRMLASNFSSDSEQLSKNGARTPPAAETEVPTPAGGTPVGTPSDDEDYDDTVSWPHVEHELPADPLQRSVTGYDVEIVSTLPTQNRANRKIYISMTDRSYVVYHHDGIQRGVLQNTNINLSGLTNPLDEALKREILTLISKANDINPPRLVEHVVDHQSKRPPLYPTFGRWIANRPLLDYFPINFVLLAIEVVLKTIGAAIIDAYVYFREKLRGCSNSNYGGMFLWSTMMVITGLLNALVAQPLFFVANVASHVRTFFDGLFNFFLIAPFSEEMTAKSAAQAMARGTLGLLADGLVAGVAYGLAGICSIIPGAQVAVPFLTGMATVVQAATGSIIVSAATAVAAAVSAIFVTAGSRLVQHEFSVSTGQKENSPGVNIFRELGINKIKDDTSPSLSPLSRSSEVAQAIPPVRLSASSAPSDSANASNAGRSSSPKVHAAGDATPPGSVTPPERPGSAPNSSRRL